MSRLPDALIGLAISRGGQGPASVRKNGPGFPGRKQILWVKYSKSERGNRSILAVKLESRKSL
eukprot:1191718-Prorocentrum_minimum.AAC.1